MGGGEGCTGLSCWCNNLPFCRIYCVKYRAFNAEFNSRIYFSFLRSMQNIFVNHLHGCPKHMMLPKLKR